MPSLVEVDRLSASWGRREVVRAVSFSVAEGELLALLGPNGSGKSTLLRAIAGLQGAVSGSVRLAGATLDLVPPHRRSIGMLFQEPTLFPHRTVYENIAYGPLLARRPDPEVHEEVRGLATLLELDPLLDRSPDELSGGERQRVALARTLAARPRLVLLDEPFASVDPALRATLLAQFRHALRERGATAIHVTHDREEALFLGDRLALLFDGRLTAIGAPTDVFHHPADVRTARFLGYNVLDGGEGPIAVLPEALRAEPAADGFRLVASGRSSQGFRAILLGPRGEQVELRGADPLPGPGPFRLRWDGGIPLAPDASGPQSPRSPER